MQITIKTVRVAKAGESGKGAWELIAVTSQKGTEYTTFDKKIKHLGEGSIIEIGEPDEKKGKLSFKEIIEVVKEVAPGSESAGLVGNGHGPAGYKRDTEAIQLEYELKAGIVAVERVSIEAQTAYNGVIAIITSEHIAQMDKAVQAPLNDLINKAIKWGESRLDAKPPKLPLPKAQSKEKALDKTEEKHEPRYPHIGALLKHCADIGINRTQFMEIVKVKEADLPKLDIETAATLIDDYEKEHPRKNEEIFPETPSAT